MKITMVKKRLPNGEECRKCREATKLLQQRGHWEKISKVVYFVNPDDPNDEGAKLAKQFGVAKAPFFIVEKDGDQPKVYRSVLKLMREVFAT